MSRPIRRTTTTALAIAIAALGLGVSAAGARVAHPERTSCTGKFVNGAMRLCGPATARLSVFPGFTFRNGTCKRLTVAGAPQFVLELGALVPGSRTNGGLAYLRIEIDGPLSNPTSGFVISWNKGKRWAGLGESFTGTARSGTFVVKGVPANGGRRATGSFRC